MYFNMEKFVIDTNFFFNLEIKTGLGNNPKEIIIEFTRLARQLKTTKKAEFYMPPSIVDELLTFVDKDDEYVKNFLELITIKAPDLNSIQLSANVFYQLVKEARERSYRAMKVAEEIVDQTGNKMMKKAELSKVEYQQQIGELITKLRERYRQATRVKFLDSPADFELIALAKELNGQLITSDEGVLIWGRKIGVSEIIPNLVKDRFNQLIQD